MQILVYFRGLYHNWRMLEKCRKYVVYDLNPAQSTHRIKKQVYQVCKYTRDNSNIQRKDCVTMVLQYPPKDGNM